MSCRHCILLDVLPSGGVRLWLQHCAACNVCNPRVFISKNVFEFKNSAFTSGMFVCFWAVVHFVFERD